MLMRTVRQGETESRSAGRPRSAVLIAVILALIFPAAASAQLFSDHPPPIPPAPVPEPPAGPAMNLAPPSGPASIPNLPPTLTQPSAAAVPPVAPPPAVAPPSQAVLALAA